MLRGHAPSGEGIGLTGPRHPPVQIEAKFACLLRGYAPAVQRPRHRSCPIEANSPLPRRRPVHPRRPLAVEAPAAPVADPEAHQVALVPLVVGEGAAVVDEFQVVEQLQLAAFHAQLDPQFLVRHHFLQRGQGLGALGVQGLAGQFMALADQVVVEAPVQAAVLPGQRRRIGHLGGVRGVLGLPVVVEGPVEPLQQFGVALPQSFEAGVDGAEAADAPTGGGAEAEQADDFGHGRGEAVVGVEDQFRIGPGGPHAVAEGAAGVGHVVEHGAVPLLGHGAAHQQAQYPVGGLGFLLAVALQGQAIHHAEPDALHQQRAHPPHQRAAGGQLELLRRQQPFSRSMEFRDRLDPE